MFLVLCYSFIRIIFIEIRFLFLSKNPFLGNWLYSRNCYSWKPSHNLLVFYFFVNIRVRLYNAASKRFQKTLERLFSESFLPFFKFNTSRLSARTGGWHACHWYIIASTKAGLLHTLLNPVVRIPSRELSWVRKSCVFFFLFAQSYWQKRSQM